MARLLVCCEQDTPSYNMKKILLDTLDWEDLGTDGVNTYLSCGDLVLMTIDRMHIYAEGIDRTARDFGIDVRDMVVLSKHSSASGKPTLTVHPIGNYHDNALGGRERTLVRSVPHLMTGTLRRIKELNDTDFSVSFEVTHHGPYVDVPAMYIEVGSDESRWGDVHAADILVHSLLSAEEKDYPVVIGVGGGHYAPRFTDLIFGRKVDIGHMLPNYQIQDSSDDDITRMLKDATEATGTDTVYLHRNSMKGPEERRVKSIIDSLGLKMISSNDLEPLV